MSLVSSIASICHCEWVVIEWYVLPEENIINLVGFWVKFLAIWNAELNPSILLLPYTAIKFIPVIFVIKTELFS